LNGTLTLIGVVVLLLVAPPAGAQPSPQFLARAPSARVTRCADVRLSHDPVAGTQDERGLTADDLIVGRLRSVVERAHQGEEYS
jgi:hypothetical protein